MASATALAAAPAVVGGVTSIAKFFEGQQLQRDAQKAINEFKFQDLQNPYESQQVSTLGADLRKEQADLAASQNIAALQGAGTRGLVSGLGRVEAQRNITNREIASNLDEQQKAIDRAKAQQDVMNQQMIEQRQREELAGLGQQMNVGLGMRYQALTDLTNAAGAGATALGGMNQGESFGGFTPQVQSVGDIQTQGYTAPPSLGGTPTLLPQYTGPNYLDWSKIKL